VSTTNATFARILIRTRWWCTAPHATRAEIGTLEKPVFLSDNMMTLKPSSIASAASSQIRSREWTYPLTPLIFSNVISSVHTGQCECTDWRFLSALNDSSERTGDGNVKRWH